MWDPSFDCGVAWGLLALLVYYGNERSVLHRKVVEKIFKSCMYGWAAYVVLVVPDSPFLQLDLGVARGAVIVLAAMTYGCFVHGTNRASRMKSSIQSEDLNQFAKQHTETVSALITISYIHKLLADQRSWGWIQYCFYELYEALTGKGHPLQVKVADSLEACSTTEPEASSLLYVLNCGDVALPELLAATGTKRVVRLLAQTIQYMDVVTKTRLIDALQRQAEFIFLRHEQELATQLLTSTYGEDLSTMKDLIDEGGDFYNLHKLIFFDLASDLRDLALEHMEKEALQLVRDFDDAAPLKILSDVDDTLYCSGGHFPAGVDKRCPKGQVYPGVLALFRELSNHNHSRLNLVSPHSARAARCIPVQPVPTHSASGRLVAATASQISKLLSVRERLFGSGGHAKNPVWLRVSAHEWVEAPVQPGETVAALKQRLSDLRTTSGGGKQGGNDFLGEPGPDVSFAPPVLRVMSNLAFLSARPHTYKDLAESKSYHLFRNLRRMGLMHCMPTLLPGRMGSSVGAAFSGGVLKFKQVLSAVLPLFFASTLLVSRSLASPASMFSFVLLLAFLYGAITTRKLGADSEVWQQVGEDKVKNFLQYRRLYSGHATVLFGDNGQGDLVCGEQLARLASDARDHDEAGPPCVSAVFIHQVLPSDSQLTTLPAGWDETERNEEWKRLNIYFHRTYVGAAVHAYRCGLLSGEGLARVGNAAVEDLIRMRINCLLDTKKTWKSLIDDLNADVEEANQILPEHMYIALVPASASITDPKDFRKGSVADFSFLTSPPRSLS